jgi:hypothetical protein
MELILVSSEFGPECYLGQNANLDRALEACRAQYRQESADANVRSEGLVRIETMISNGNPKCNGGSTIREPQFELTERTQNLQAAKREKRKPGSPSSPPTLGNNTRQRAQRSVQIERRWRWTTISEGGHGLEDRQVVEA